MTLALRQGLRVCPAPGLPLPVTAAFAYVQHQAQPLTLKTICLGQGRGAPFTRHPRPPRHPFQATPFPCGATSPLTHFILTRVGSYGAFGPGLDSLSSCACVRHIIKSLSKQANYMHPTIRYPAHDSCEQCKAKKNTSSYAQEIMHIFQKGFQLHCSLCSWVMFLLFENIGNKCVFIV